MDKRKHERLTHTNCERDYCPTCDGALFQCKNCRLAEGSLTTECPGSSPISEEKEAAIYGGYLDFKEGEWVEGRNTIRPTY